jgi:hypothetical protein
VNSAARFWPTLEAEAGLATTGDVIYEYTDGGASSPTIVGVTGPANSTSLISACGTLLGGLEGEHKLYNTISADGSTVIFTAEPCPNGTGVNHEKAVLSDEVYERIVTPGGAKTVLVSGPGPESVCTSGCRTQPTAAASVQGASTDDSRIYFTSTGQLTDEASEDRRATDSAAIGCTKTAVTASGCNLYLFECPDDCAEPSARSLVDVSAGDSSGLGPQVQGVVAIPPDGSDVYFLARGVLASTPNEAGLLPVAGGENLYVAREHHVVFIATVSTVDADSLLGDSGIGVANVTPDGRYLVFSSHRGLTSDAVQGEGTAQIYR